MATPGYQTLLDRDIPSVELPDGAGRVRVIAGEFDGQRGPARTFTPIDVWDVRLAQGKTRSSLCRGTYARTDRAARDRYRKRRRRRPRSADGAVRSRRYDVTSRRNRCDDRVARRRTDRRADRRLRPVRDEHRGRNPPGNCRLQQRAVRSNRGVKEGATRRPMEKEANESKRVHLWPKTRDLAFRRLRQWLGIRVFAVYTRPFATPPVAEPDMPEFSHRLYDQRDIETLLALAKGVRTGNVRRVCATRIRQG